MSTLLDLLSQQLKNVDFAMIGSQLGLSPAVTQSAIAHSLPAMLESLANHASSSPAAAEELHALLEDSMARDLQSDLSRSLAVATAPTSVATHAEKIDDSTLEQIARTAGIAPDQLRQLILQLSPLLASALTQANELHAFSPSGMSTFLQSAKEQIQSNVENAVGYAESHPDELRSGLIGAGSALAGQFFLGRK